MYCDSRPLSLPGCNHRAKHVIMLRGHIATFFSGMLICSCWSQKPQEAHFLASLIRNTILPLPPLEYHEYSEGLHVPPLSFPYDVTYVTTKESFQSKQKLEQEKANIFVGVHFLSNF